MGHKRRDYSGRTSSPQDSRRGCLCADEETYSIECCDGELINQGLGSLVSQGNPLFDCDAVTLSGFSVAQNGDITLPTVDVGTILSTTPSSFSVVGTDTARTLSVVIKAPNGYSNSGARVTCTTTATQPLLPSLTCSDVTLSGFAVAQNGTITLPTIDIGTITSTSPSSFALVSVNTVRTLSVDITVPSGYFNAGSTITCTTTATQPLSPTLTCSDITFSGFSVSQSGTVTQGSIDIGTIISTTPSSVSANTNTSATSVDLTVRVQAPVSYLNAGSQFDCTVTVSQPGLTLTRYSASWAGTKSITIQTHHNGSTQSYSNIKGGAVVFSYNQPTGDTASWTAGATDITLAGFDTAVYSQGDPDVGLDAGIFTFTHYSSSAFTSVQSGTGTGNVQICTLSLQNISGSDVPIAPHNPAANGLKAYASPYASNAPVSSGLGTLVSDGFYTIAGISTQVRVSGGLITVQTIP
tara:strand:+ start:147 stop:1547 length:1401 start_codon:yes stop_codon:yes gene_type:complete